VSCASCVIIIISRWVHGGLLRSVIPASHSSVSHADEHRQKHSTTRPRKRAWKRRKEKRRGREGRGRSEVESRSLSDMRRNQRQSNSLDYGNAVRTAIGSQGFSYTAPSTWNKLPLELRNSSPFASFKRNHNTCYFPVPSLRPASPSPLANARASLHEVKNNGRYI